ncbi:DNA repair protein RadA [Wolbachia endosymbiont of Brugia malayi]|uniref:DNA repair protein RadA n=1 Tax=Wolbachia endosymbiont of Brugia malayi TaxID=80849 RepID=UPI0002E0915B|nr:DNA repair protein RadA [Wolbachia endosymbiont of Brugia malayi]
MIKTDTRNISVPTSIKALSDSETITSDHFLTGIEESDRVFGESIVQGASIFDW